MRKIEKVAKIRNITVKEALKKRLKFLKESKIKKWNKNLNIYNVGNICPFCVDTICRPNISQLNCEKCLCPPDICDDNAHEGYIDNIISKITTIFKADYSTNVTYFEKRKNAKRNLDERLPVMIGLFDKWIEETEIEIQYIKNSWINEKCPFCYNLSEYGFSDCRNCLCPQEICSDKMKKNEKELSEYEKD